MPLPAIAMGVTTVLQGLQFTSLSLGLLDRTKSDTLDRAGLLFGKNGQDAKSITDEIRALDIDNGVLGTGIDKLISDPLNACVQAQSDLNMQYISSLLDLCEVEEIDETPDEGSSTGKKTQRLVLREVHLAIKTKEGYTDIRAPLLSFVQPVQLGISQCHIDFTAEVTNNLQHVSTSKNNSNSTTNSASGFLQTMLVGKSSTTGTLSSENSSSKTINSTKKNIYTVSVKADMVENQGMKFLQEMIRNATTVVPIPTKA